MAIDKKTITVFGGTGNQGGSVVRSLLHNKNQSFQVRVITRNPDSESARACADLGAEVVQADGFDRADTVAAFSGSWGAFINTNSDDEYFKVPGNPGDFDLGSAVIDAAEEAGVRHVVYSSGPNLCMCTNGKVHIQGFESKWYVEQYARKKTGFQSFVPVLPGSMMECWLAEPFCKTFGGFPWWKPEHAGENDGSYLLTTPAYGGDGKMPWVSIEDDFGDIIHGIFLDPTRYHHQIVQATSQLVQFEQMAKDFSQVTGEPCRYVQMPSWTDIELDGTSCRVETRLIFFYMNSNGGKWFGPDVSEMQTSTALKKAAIEAQGHSNGDSNSTLITFNQWMKKQWKRKPVKV